MSRYHVEWTERLSAYLADELGDADRTELEAHLAGCGACRGVLAELGDVVARAGTLPELEPPRDLWPGVSSAIGGPVRAVARPDDPSVLELPSARAGRDAGSLRGRTPGRIQVRRSRLVAAAAALVAVSVGTTWWLAGARTGATQAASLPAAPSAGAVTAAATGTPPADLASELAALEEVLDVARNALDPNTVLVLERNLGVIERAIADSRQALEVDPGNAFLREHLERMYRRKLVYLQDVVQVMRWEG
ncbi:MAG TPA: zf-HC2 domain-containing protein [Longimicrobiales bacterium]|nr:zf-HC2 domain-containing protein [Longimicrobiales bacterium]